MNDGCPLSWYFDEARYDAEIQQLFRNYGGFAGLCSAVPLQGDYRVLTHTQDGVALVRGPEGIKAVRNTCRHRQATMLEGGGNLPHHLITCPIHKWSYGLDGKLAASPSWHPRPCVSLFEMPLAERQGMLFFDSAQADALGRCHQLADVDFRLYERVGESIDRYDINWKEYIDVFMDDYHINAYHPGLRALVDVRDLQWDFGDGYSLQRVGFRRRFYDRPGSDAYARYAEGLQRVYGRRVWDYGAVWVVLYPNIILEFLQSFLLTTIVVPEGPRRMTLHTTVYALPDAAADAALVSAYHASADETEREDGRILEAVSHGRYELYAHGIDDRGPYHEPTEAGMREFHRWVSQLSLGTPGGVDCLRAQKG